MSQMGCHENHQISRSRALPVARDSRAHDCRAHVDEWDVGIVAVAYYERNSNAPFDFQDSIS